MVSSLRGALQVVSGGFVNLWRNHQPVVLAFGVGVVLYSMGWCTGIRHAGRDVIHERIKVLTKEVKVADSIFVHDTVVATKLRTKYDSIRVRDTVTRNDTVFVPRAVADGTIQACTLALQDCVHVRALNDSLKVQILKIGKPSLLSHCGIGPSASLIESGGTVHAGIGLSATCLLWHL